MKHDLALRDGANVRRRRAGGAATTRTLGTNACSTDAGSDDENDAPTAAGGAGTGEARDERDRAALALFGKFVREVMQRLRQYKNELLAGRFAACAPHAGRALAMAAMMLTTTTTTTT